MDISKYLKYKYKYISLKKQLGGGKDIIRKYIDNLYTHYKLSEANIIHIEQLYNSVNDKITLERFINMISKELNISFIPSVHSKLPIKLHQYSKEIVFSKLKQNGINISKIPKGTILFRSAPSICNYKDVLSCLLICTDTKKKGIYFGDELIISIGMCI